MANVLVEETSLTNIADSIRTKNGSSDKYTPAEMAQAIDNITVNGVNTMDATATELDVAEGETFYAGDKKLTGQISITNEMSLAGSFDKEDLGHYSFIANNDTKKIIAADAILKTNIPVEDFGQATADQIPQGLTFTSKDGFNITGTYVPNYQEKTVNPALGTQEITPEAGYAALSKVTITPITTTAQATPTIDVDAATGLITATHVQSNSGWVNAGTKTATQQLNVQDSAGLTISGKTATVAPGFYTTSISQDVATTTMPKPTLSLNNTTGVVTSNVNLSSSGYMETGASNSGTLQLQVKGDADLTANGDAITAAAGFYPSAVSKAIEHTVITKPTVSINQSTGVVTANINQSTSGYIPSGSTNSATLNLTTIDATTYIPSTTDQIIPANRYTTGIQTIKGDVNLTADKIVYPNTIFGVQGNVQIVGYYTGSTVPSNSLGQDGDLYFRS